MKMKQPQKLETLRRNAAKTTAQRGHRLSWQKPWGRCAVPHLGQLYENFSQEGVCKCGAWVTVRQLPAPNGSAIGGPAVAINCPL